MKPLFTILLSLLFFTYGLSQNEFGVGVNGGINIPVGNFHKYYSLGYAGDAQVLYNVNNAFILVLTSGYHLWNVDNDSYNKGANDLAQNLKYSFDSHFKIIPIYLGIRYYLGRGKHRPFFSLDFGGYSYEFKISGTINSTLPNANSISIKIPETKKTDTQTALAVGFGYFYNLSKSWNLEVHSKYTVLSSAYIINEPDKLVAPDDASPNYGSTKKLNFVSLSAGVNYIF